MSASDGATHYSHSSSASQGYAYAHAQGLSARSPSHGGTASVLTAGTSSSHARSPSHRHHGHGHHHSAGVDWEGLFSSDPSKAASYDFEALRTDAYTKAMLLQTQRELVATLDTVTALKTQLEKIGEQEAALAPTVAQLTASQTALAEQVVNEEARGVSLRNDLESVLSVTGPLAGEKEAIASLVDDLTRGVATRQAEKSSLESTIVKTLARVRLAQNAASSKAQEAKQGLAKAMVAADARERGLLREADEIGDHLEAMRGEVLSLEAGVHEVEAIEDDILAMERSLRLFAQRKLRLTIDQVNATAASEAARLERDIEDLAITAESYAGECAAMEEDCGPLRAELEATRASVAALQAQIDEVQMERVGILSRAPLLAAKVAARHQAQAQQQAAHGERVLVD